MKEEGDALRTISNWLSFDGRGPVGRSQCWVELKPVFKLELKQALVTLLHNTTLHNTTHHSRE